MDRRVWKKSLVLMVGMLALAATTAWAGFEWETYCAYLNGISQGGNPTYLAGSTKTTFVALENTCNGSVIGTSRARVNNYSGKFQAYVNNPCFGYITCINVNSSLYVVDPWGNATLTATGFDYCDAR